MKERWTETRIQKFWVGRFLIRALGCADCGKVQIITPNFATTSTGSGTRESAASDICKDEAFPAQLQPSVGASGGFNYSCTYQTTSVQPVCRRNHSEQTSTKSETRLVLSLSVIIDLDPVGLTHWKVVVIGRCGTYSFFQNALDFAFVFIGGGTGRAPGHRAPL